MTVNEGLRKYIRVLRVKQERILVARQINDTNYHVPSPALLKEIIALATWFLENATETKKERGSHRKTRRKKPRSAPKFWRVKVRLEPIEGAVLNDSLDEAELERRKGYG